MKVEIVQDATSTVMKPVSKTKQKLRSIWKYRWQYAMIMPGFVLVFLFNYMPMAGIQVAFKDYNIFEGIWTSEWIGFENFYFLKDSEFWRVFSNTIWITVLKFVFGFPAPIILALLLNDIKNKTFKKWVQTLTYMPHFVSWIVVAYIVEALLSQSSGLVNGLLAQFGIKPIYFMGSEEWFRPIIIFSSVWKEVGFSAIIYLAAIAGLNPQLYEAAVVDGANKWKQALHVTIPGIMPTISIMLILTIPSLLNAGFDQIYPLQNPINQPVSEVIDTYVVKTGLNQGYYGPATAIGLVTSVVQLILVVGANQLSKRYGNTRLF
ncbi:ABC transporter permease [Neobacillus drentensis]|uniref:ABC transporter permease n=1 Tax=Neobacillus drentensis TaxID=220684 RepID=UPI002FFF3EF1